MLKPEGWRKGCQGDKKQDSGVETAQGESGADKEQQGAQRGWNVRG